MGAGDPSGGMEGKVGVVATGSQPVGKQGRQRLTPRRYVATFGESRQVGRSRLRRRRWCWRATGRASRWC